MAGEGRKKEGRMRGVEVEGEGRRSFSYCCVRIHYWLIEFLPLGTGTSVFILYN